MTSAGLDDDFLQNLESGAGEFGGGIMNSLADRGLGFRDERLEQFYNRLGEYNSSWLDLEGLNYKCSRIDRFNFVKQVEQMTEVPDLQYYKIAISRNGGPIAFMLKENTFFFGKKDDTKDYIFIFSSYGKLINTINLKQKIPDLKDNQRWAAFNFTDEEDLFIISDAGDLYMIDPKTGDFRDREPIKIHVQFTINKLVDSRFDQATNSIVLRNQVAQFFYIKNIQ